MKEYVINGGDLFIVMSIDVIRDGGTKIIKTTNCNYYINKNNKTFHTDYEPNEENLITDFLLIQYLIDRIYTHIKNCKQYFKENKTILLEIKNNNK